MNLQDFPLVRFFLRVTVRTYLRQQGSGDVRGEANQLGVKLSKVVVQVFIDQSTPLERCEPAEK